MGKWFQKKKRLIAVFMTLMMLFTSTMAVFADVAIAYVDGGNSENHTASNSDGDLFGAVVDNSINKYLRVHASGSYADIGASKVQFFPENNKGTIRLISSITFTINGKKVTLPKGVWWNFKVSSYEDGAKITLTFEQSQSPASAASIVKKYNMETMTGKIHIDSKRFSKLFWKIDCLGCGFYFRCD